MGYDLWLQADEVLSAPINLSLRAIAIPLACGNPVILKASEYSPMSQRIVVDLLLEVMTVYLGGGRRTFADRIL